MINKNILIVDNDAVCLSQIKDRLTSSGNQLILHEANDLESAISKLRVAPISYVIVRLSLTDQLGIMLLQMIKKDYCGSKVVTLVPFSDEFYKFLCKKFNADYCFTNDQLSGLPDFLAASGYQAIAN